MQYSSLTVAARLRLLLGSAFVMFLTVAPLRFAAATNCDAIITQYDVPMLIHEVQLPVGLPVVNMGA